MLKLQIESVRVIYICIVSKYFLHDTLVKKLYMEKLGRVKRTVGETDIGTPQHCFHHASAKDAGPESHHQGRLNSKKTLQDGSTIILFLKKGAQVS